MKPERIRWRWAIVVPTVMMLIALFPQMYFALYRGHQWHEANAISHADEVAYSAYLASLIRGNPRRYDPYTGRDQPAESLFSVQFVSVYVAAWPARLLGLRASFIFMIQSPIVALTSSLTVSWLFLLDTR